MKTWKTKKTICRRTKSGRFASKKKCGQFKRQRVKSGGFLGALFG
jgi:hypothetical protein